MLQLIFGHNNFRLQYLGCYIFVSSNQSENSVINLFETKDYLIPVTY